MLFYKWMLKEGIWCRVYNRHPDTGNNKFQGAYVYVDTRHTEEGIKKLFIEHDWEFLKKDRYYLIFVKESICEM